MRHHCVYLTENEAAAAVWIPPAEAELNDTEEVQIHELIGDELGPDAARVLVMLDQIDDPFRPQPDGPVVTTIWRDPQ